MKSEGIEILLFILIVASVLVIGVSEDYSYNSMIRSEKQRQETEQIARNQAKINQFKSEQEIHSLGCATLDCAIEKSRR